MDASIRADDVIDLDTAFDGDSFLAFSAGAASLNLSSLTINDMDQDRYHDDDDDELNDDLGIQPRFLSARFGPNGGKKGKDWRRESVALFKKLNEGNADVSFDLLSSEMNEMFENPLLVDEDEPRSALRSVTPHRAVAPHKEDKKPEVALTTINKTPAGIPTTTRQASIDFQSLDSSLAPQPSTPKTPCYASYFDQDTPQQQDHTPTTTKRPTSQRQRTPLHTRTSPINVGPAPGTPTRQPIDDEEDVIFFGPPTAKEKQASAKVHSMLGGEGAMTPKAGTPRRSYQRGGEVYTPTSARHRTLSVGSKTALKTSGSLWPSEELEKSEEDENPPTPKPPVFTSLAMLGRSPERRNSNTLTASPTTASPTTASPTSASRTSFAARREALLGSGSPPQTSPTSHPFLARRNTTGTFDPSTIDLSASSPGDKQQYSSDTVAAAMEFMLQRTPTKPALVRQSSDLSPTPTLTATTPPISNGSPTQRHYNQKIAAAMQLATQVLSPGRPRSFSYAPRDSLDLDLVPGTLASSKSKARSNSIAAIPSPGTTCNPLMLSPPIDVPFAALIPLPDSASTSPDKRIDPPPLLRRSSEAVIAAMHMLERRGSSPKLALMEHARMEERAKALAAKEGGESPMLIDLETPVRGGEKRGILRRVDERNTRTDGAEMDVVEKRRHSMVGTPTRLRKVSGTQNQSRREAMELVAAVSDKESVKKSNGDDAKVQVQAEKELGVGTPSRLRRPSRTQSQFVMDLVRGIEEKDTRIGTPTRLRKPSGSQQQLRSIPTSETKPTQTSARFPLSSSGAFALNFASHRTGVTTSRATEDAPPLSTKLTATTASSFRRYNFDQPRDKDVDMAIDPLVRETSAYRRYLSERSSAATRTDNIAARERDGDGDTAMLDDAASSTPSSTRISARLASRRSSSARQEDAAVTPRLADGKLPNSGVASSTEKLGRVGVGIRLRGVYPRNRVSAETTVPKRKFQERNDLMDEDQNNGREKMIQKEIAGATARAGGGIEVGTRLPVIRKPNLRLDEKLVTKLVPLPRRSGIATASSIPAATTSISRLKVPTRIGATIKNEVRPPAARTIAKPSSRLAAPASYTARRG